MYTTSDAAWILSKAFIILTMQSGFALLEVGFVASKNVASILVKNAIDVCFGWLVYLIFRIFGKMFQKVLYM